jgi:hypothetical protein
MYSSSARLRIPVIVALHCVRLLFDRACESKTSGYPKRKEKKEKRQRMGIQKEKRKRKKGKE